MSLSSIDRLKDYLAQLPPKAQALLMREFERSVERGEDVSVAKFVLEELRKVARSETTNATPRVQDPMRLAFRQLEPFLVDGGPVSSPGRIRRSSLGPIWLWITREGAVEAVKAFEAALAEKSETTDLTADVRRLQASIANAIAPFIDPKPDADRSRLLGRIGTPSVIEDLVSIGAVFQAREAFDLFNTRLPSFLRVFSESQVASVAAVLNVPSVQNPRTLPFALMLVTQRMAEPWQIIRLAISVAASDNEARIASTPYGVAVAIAIDNLSRTAVDLQTDMKRGKFHNVASHLKKLHDGLRGLRTEIDFRPDSAWGRKLVTIRADISRTLENQIENVPGRVRRLLRQRADKEVSAGMQIDAADVDETAALIDFVAICRNYASELAINEVTLRTHTDLQHYVEKSTETLVDSLRTGDAKLKAFRRLQAKAAIRFCEVLFGSEYAALMRKAADIAGADERSEARAS
jgi:hypothetical protein